MIFTFLKLLFITLVAPAFGLLPITGSLFEIKNSFCYFIFVESLGQEQEHLNSPTSMENTHFFIRSNSLASAWKVLNFSSNLALNVS